MKDISVTYLGGSGFLAWYGDTGFLFDASKNGPDERILPEPETLNAFRRLFVFISHHHLNNFDPDIYSIVPEHAVFFLGYDIPDEFIVGYGLDFAQHYRNLPYLGVLRHSVYEKK